MDMFSYIFLLLLSGTLVYIGIAGIYISLILMRPPLMSFGMFKYICSKGRRIPLNDLPDDLLILTELRPTTPLYRNWHSAVIERGDITRLEFHCINCQVSKDIQAEISKREIESK